MGTVVITGATSGIGLETARELAKKGFHVLGVGRTAENCAKARASILSGNPDAIITYFTADLMQQREVLRVAAELTAYLNERCGGMLNVLINNAGCARSWYMTTYEGYEQQFALNYLAGFLLTHELLPLLTKARGRVIMTGSGSHKGIRVRWDDVMLQRGYNPLTAYKQSKLCCMLLARGLNDRCGASGVRAYVVDPGLVNTDIGGKAGGIVSFVWKFRRRRGMPPAAAAGTFVFLCAQEAAPQGFCYRLCREIACSGQVTGANAGRLFALSERLCGFSRGKGDAA